MIKEAPERRQFQIVIVWKLDRFARNRYDSAIYKARLKKTVSGSSPRWRTSGQPGKASSWKACWRAWRSIIPANLSVNVKRGQRETLAKGRFCGGVGCPTAMR